MHQFRGISKASGQWVHGGFWYDGNEYYIIRRLHELVPIIPETLGKQILYGGMSFYSGDIVMWSRFREELRNAARLEDLIHSGVGIVMHGTMAHDNGTEGERIVITEEQYTCGVELEELHPSGIKIIGNIFDSGFYRTANPDCYSVLKPYWFTGTGSGETVNKEMAMDGETEYILCRRENHDDGSRYGGSYFVFSEIDTAKEVAKNMVSSLGWKEDDIKIFKESSRISEF